MGKIEITITTDALDLALIGNWLPAAQHGAANIFIGYVRSINAERTVVGINYDCFIPLAETVCRQIAVEAQEQWGADINILIMHRYGYLRVGEASIAIIATTGHRDASYQASRYIIEAIKIRAPIWKKEYYHDGDTAWSSGQALAQQPQMKIMSRTPQPFGIEGLVR